MAKKKKTTTKKPTKKPTRKSTRVQDASGGNDRASSRKFARGGRVEAYTWGEALKSKRWP